MTGFEPRTSGVGSHRSINWATTTAQSLRFLVEQLQHHEERRRPRPLNRFSLFNIFVRRVRRIPGECNAHAAANVKSRSRRSQTRTRIRRRRRRWRWWMHQKRFRRTFFEFFYPPVNLPPFVSSSIREVQERGFFLFCCLNNFLTKLHLGQTTWGGS